MFGLRNPQPTRSHRRERVASAQGITMSRASRSVPAGPRRLELSFLCFSPPLLRRTGMAASPPFPWDGFNDGFLLPIVGLPCVVDSALCLGFKTPARTPLWERRGATLASSLLSSNWPAGPSLFSTMATIRTLCAGGFRDLPRPRVFRQSTRNLTDAIAAHS